jgi:hypothetical protein
MATQVELIQDPLFTATMAAVFEELRNLLDYLLASNAEMLEDFPAGDARHAVLLQALASLRAMAGSVSLDKLLEKSRSRAYARPVARPAGAGPRIIDIDEGGNSSDGQIEA